MEKTEPKKDEYDQMVKDLTEEIKDLVKEWKEGEAGSLGNWIELFKQIMEFAQDLKTVPGLTKANICIDVISNIAQSMLDENVANLPEETVKTLNLVLSDQGLQILKATTGVIKNFIAGIDTNNDGHISKEELEDFFCGCCPRLKKD